MMDEFLAKKIGELVAFAEVEIETLKKGKTAFSKVLSSKKLDSFSEENLKHADILRKIAADSGSIDSVMKKSDSTGMQLRSMRDSYLKEEGWDEPIELFEWM